jgi:hypothetical protein
MSAWSGLGIAVAVVAGIAVVSVTAVLLVGTTEGGRQRPKTKDDPPVAAVRNEFPKKDEGKPKAAPKTFTRDEVRDLVGRTQQLVRNTLGEPAARSDDGEGNAVWRYEGLSRPDDGGPPDRATTLRFEGKTGRLRDVSFE